MMVILHIWILPNHLSLSAVYRCQGVQLLVIGGVGAHGSGVPESLGWGVGGRGVTDQESGQCWVKFQVDLNVKTDHNLKTTIFCIQKNYLGMKNTMRNNEKKPAISIYR